MIVDKSGAGDYKTLEEAINNAVSGSTIKIKSVIYHEEAIISNVDGTPDLPITIMPFDDGEVIFTGAKEIVSNWSKWNENENVYKTSILHLKSDFTNDIWQLFVEDTMMVTARWPNAINPWFENSNWWDRESTWEKVDGTSPKGTIVDGGQHNLSSTQKDFTGAIAVLNINSMITYQDTVRNHSAGSNQFNYDYSSFYLFKDALYKNISKGDVWEFSTTKGTGIFSAKNKKDILKLFPTVGSNFITITNIPLHSDYKVFNINGIKIMEGCFIDTEEILSISHLPSGLYYLALKDTSIMPIRFIKM
ncbi:hypothetical protein E9993_12795 [Labilibacter sediminis]|nr:hypothetical protein E9993_12795 [Labilibacter sediminis]